MLTTDDGVELAVGGLLGQVATEFIQGRGLGGALPSATAAAGDFSGLAQHANDLGADLGQIDAEVLENTGCDAFAFADQAQEQVFRTDVVVAELTGFLEGELKYPFCSGRERNFNRDEAGTTADNFLDLDPSVLEVDPHGLQDLRGDAGAFADQAQEDLLGAHEVVTQAAGLFLGQHDHLDGLLGKPLEHGAGPGCMYPQFIRVAWGCVGWISNVQKSAPRQRSPRMIVTLKPLKVSGSRYQERAAIRTASQSRISTHWIRASLPLR